MQELAVRRSDQRLREERIDRRWTQQEMADRIGTTPNNISRWELGVTTPGPYFRRKLCDLFDKSAQELGLCSNSVVDGHAQAFQRAPQTPAIHRMISPCIWNIPYRRNPFFTGREDILLRLHKALHSGSTSSSLQVHAISGLGGIGKTQLAIEYAYRNREDYQAVLWMRADSHETLLIEISVLVELLGLPEKDESDQSRISRAIKRWFQEQDGWLLILDNIEDFKILDEVVPPVHTGHVLLTTRARAVGTLAHCIDLESLDTQEGALFLLRRARRIAPDTNLEDISLQDQQNAREIAMSMDGLPLALDQAGAYLEETGCSLSGYLESYQTQSTTLLSLRGGTVQHDHPASVAMTFSLAIKQVEQIQPAAAELLRCCSFLHPDAIGEEILLGGALGSLLQSTASNTLALDAAIKVLLQFSMVRRNPDNKTLTIHRLVQEVLRDTMSEEVQGQWAQRVVQAVNSVFPDVLDLQDPGIWRRCQRYLPQVMVCAKLVQQWQITSPEAARLLNQAGLYCLDHGQYIQSEALLEQALAIQQKTLPGTHPEMAETLNYLALLYHQSGRYAQAEPLYQQTLTILEQQLGPVHPDVALSLQCLATCYHYQGNFAQVTPLYQRALAILEQTVGPSHPQVADNFNDLARLYREQDRGTEAEALYKQALAIYQQNLGHTHPSVATCLSNIGLLYSEQGRELEAEDLLRRALGIYEQALGLDHPHVARCLNHLALLAGKRRRFAQARTWGQQALAIRQQIYGPEHPLMAESLTTLGVLAEQQGRQAQANTLFEYALTILELTVGPTSPLVAQYFFERAELLLQRGHDEEAGPFYQRALAIWEQALGSDHPRATHCMERFADLQERLRPASKAVADKAESKPGPATAPRTSASPGTSSKHEQAKHTNRDFFTERCSLHPQLTSQAGDLWRAYQLWKKDGKDAVSLSRRAFAQRLQALGCRPVRTKTCRLWQGIALKDCPGDGG